MEGTLSGAPWRWQGGASVAGKPNAPPRASVASVVLEEGAQRLSRNHVWTQTLPRPPRLSVVTPGIERTETGPQEGIRCLRDHAGCLEGGVG